MRRDRDMKKKVLYTVMIIFFIIMFGFLAVPGWQGLINRIEPHILGMPCYQAWIFYGSLLMAIAMIVWCLLDFKFDDEEEAAKAKTEKIETEAKEEGGGANVG